MQVVELSSAVHVAEALLLQDLAAFPDAEFTAERKCGRVRRLLMEISRSPTAGRLLGQAAARLEHWRAPQLFDLATTTAAATMATAMVMMGTTTMIAMLLVMKPRRLG